MYIRLSNFLILIILIYAKDSNQSKPNFQLTIVPEIVNHHGAYNIIKKSEDILNVTCKIIFQSLTSDPPKFNITWELPPNLNHRPQNYIYKFNYNEANLVIPRLQESDSGEYQCTAISDNDNHLNKVFHLIVKRRCNINSFMCPDGNCIFNQYLCDGVPDCRDAADEKIDLCGLDPCEGKLPCKDNRCIPISLCCDHLTDNNCSITFRPYCCDKYPTEIYKSSTSLQKQKLSNVGYMQIPIYVIFGCGMAFMLTLTILIYAVCRIHSTQNSIYRTECNLPGRTVHHHGLQNVALYDLDLLLSGTNNQRSNNCTELLQSHSNEGPPPAYTSQDNLYNNFHISNSH